MKDTAGNPHGGTTWGANDDPATVEEVRENFRLLLTQAPARFVGLSGQRPAPGKAGREWLSTDTGELAHDDGATWRQLRPGAASGPPASGTYARGHEVRNSLPGDGKPYGWVCVVAGSPGTWLPFGGIGSASTGGGGGETGTTSDGRMGATMEETQ